MKRIPFRGSAVALVTPMQRDLSIDYARLEELLEWHIREGTDAVVISGTTGESATLSLKEKQYLAAFSIEKIAGRISVIIGTGSNNTSAAVEMTRTAEEYGADAALVVTPYYNKTTQKGLISHFFKIADESSLPLILYNVPSRTGMTIQPQTYANLAEHPNIVGVKESSGDLGAIAQTMALCGSKLAIYSGNDDQNLPIFSLGGVGIISVLANLLPMAVKQFCTFCLAGEMTQAREMQLEWMPLIRLLFEQTNPIPVKAAMRLIGKDCGACRLPLIEADSEILEAIRKVLSGYITLEKSFK